MTISNKRLSINVLFLLTAALAMWGCGGGDGGGAGTGGDRGVGGTGGGVGSTPIADAGADIEVSSGDDGLVDVATEPVDLVVAGLVGAVGLQPVLAAIRAGHSIGLANKEVMVMAGALVLREVKALADMMLLRRGMRLSIQPVTRSEWNAVLALGRRRARGIACRDAYGQWRIER